MIARSMKDTMMQTMLRKQRDFLYDVVESIAFASMDQPAAFNNPDWYKRRAYELVSQAAWALRHYKEGNI